MDLRSHDPYWLSKDGRPSHYPSLSSSISCDVAIIGAGITGALVSSHLSSHGFDVVVVDKRSVGTGSTAASTSLLQYEIDTPLRILSKSVGERNAIRSYQLCIEAIEDLKILCSQWSDYCDFQSKESFQFASYKKDIDSLKVEYDIRKKNGIDLHWMDTLEIQNKFGFHAPAGLLSKIGGQIDGYLLTHRLITQAARRGLRVYEQTEVKEIQYPSRKVKLITTNDHSIKARHLIIACGYESQTYLPKKIEKLNSTYAMASEPQSGKDPWYKSSLIWETARPYLYLRTTKDHRIIIGGKDDPFYNPEKRDRNISSKVRQLKHSFARLFPNHSFTPEFQWAGTFASTKDGLPYIGSIKQRPATTFALGFGGNGITFSLLAAQFIRDKLIHRTNKDASIFNFDR